jgi:hypothetical protein
MKRLTGNKISRVFLVVVALLIGSQLFSPSVLASNQKVVAPEFGENYIVRYDGNVITISNEKNETVVSRNFGPGYSEVVMGNGILSVDFNPQGQTVHYPRFWTFTYNDGTKITRGFAH